MRYHAMHKLSWQMSSEVVPMMLEIGGRTPEANRLWEDFSRPSHSATTRCVAVPAPRQDGEVGTGHGSAEACTRHVRTLQLRNQSIQCDSHASLISLCWLWTSGHPALAETLARWLLRISRWHCARTHAVTLWQHIAWRALHVGWSSPNTML